MDAHNEDNRNHFKTYLNNTYQCQQIMLALINQRCNYKRQKDLGKHRQTIKVERTNNDLYREIRENQQSINKLILFNILKQVVLNDEFNDLYITYCFQLAYHFETTRKREYLDYLKDLINNSGLLLSKEDPYYMAVIIYGLLEMKRMLFKASENNNYKLQIEDLIDSIQLKSVLNKIISQPAIDALKQSNLYNTIWFYFSKFLCAWMLIQIKHKKILQRSKQKELTEIEILRNKRLIDQKNNLIRYIYVQSCQVMAFALLNKKLLLLNFKEQIQIIFNMKTIDYKMSDFSQQEEKNYLFLQQILFKWQVIDKLYFSSQSKSKNLLKQQDTVEEQQQNFYSKAIEDIKIQDDNKVQSQDENKVQPFVDNKPQPIDYNKIFIDKINQKMEKYSTEVARTLLDMLNSYRQNKDNYQVNQEKHKLKSTHHIQNTHSLENLDQNPKIQVFDSDQLLQIEILVSSKHLQIDESIEYQTDTKEGATCVIRNILQNELSDKTPLKFQSFQHPNVYEIEQNFINEQKDCNENDLQLQQLFHQNIKKDIDQNEDISKNFISNLLQIEHQKQHAEQTDQQKKLSQGINNLLSKWKSNQQNKFLNYKNSDTVQQQMIRFKRSKNQQMQQQDSTQSQLKKQQTTNSFAQQKTQESLSSRQYQSINQNEQNQSSHKKNDLYFAYTSRPYSAKQRKLVSSNSNHILTTSTGKQSIKSIQELSQIYKEDQSTNSNQTKFPYMNSPNNIENILFNKQSNEEQGKNIKGKNMTMNIFQKVISNHPVHPFIMSQKSVKTEGNDEQFTDKFQPLFQGKVDFRQDSEIEGQNFMNNQNNPLSINTLKRLSKRIKTQTSIEDKNILFKDLINQSSNQIPSKVSFSLIPDLQCAAGAGNDEFNGRTIFSLKDIDAKEEEWILNAIDSERNKYQQNEQIPQTAPKTTSSAKNFAFQIGGESYSNISQSNKGLSTPFSHRLSINNHNNQSPLQLNKPQLINQQEQDQDANQSDIFSNNQALLPLKNTVPSTINIKKIIPLLNLDKIHTVQNEDYIPQSNIKSQSNLSQNYYFTSAKTEKKKNYENKSQVTKSAKDLSFQKKSAPHRKLISNSPAFDEKQLSTQRSGNSSISTHGLLTQRPKSGFTLKSTNKKQTQSTLRFKKDESLNKLMSMNNLFEGREALKNQAISQGILHQNFLNTTISLSKLQTQNSMDSVIQDKPGISTLIKCQQLESQYEEYEKAIITAYQKKNIFDIDLLTQKGKVEVLNPNELDLNIQQNMELPNEENIPSTEKLNKLNTLKQSLFFQNPTTQSLNELDDQNILSIKKCDSESMHKQESSESANQTINKGDNKTPKNQNLQLQNGLSAIQENTIDGRSPGQNQSDISNSNNQTPTTGENKGRRMFIIDAIEKKRQQNLKKPSNFFQQNLNKGDGTPKNSIRPFHAARTIRQTAPLEIVHTKNKAGLLTERTPQNDVEKILQISQMSVSQSIPNSPQNPLTFTSKLLQFNQQLNEESKKIYFLNIFQNQNNITQQLDQKNSITDGLLQKQQIQQISESFRKSIIETQNNNGGVQNSNISNSKNSIKMQQLRNSGAFRLSVKNMFKTEEKKKIEDEIRKKKYQQRQSAYLQSSHQRLSSSQKMDAEEQSLLIDKDLQSQTSNQMESMSSQDAVEQNYTKKMSPYINRIKNETQIREVSLNIDDTKLSKHNMSYNDDTPNSQTNRPSRFKQQEEAQRSEEKNQLMITSHNQNGIAPDNEFSNSKRSQSRLDTPKNQINSQNSQKNSIYISFLDSLDKSTLQVNNVGNLSNFTKNSSNFRGSGSKNVSKPKDENVLDSPGLKRMKELYAIKMKKKKIKEINKKMGQGKFDFLCKFVSALKLQTNDNHF